MIAGLHFPADTPLFSYRPQDRVARQGRLLSVSMLLDYGILTRRNDGPDGGSRRWIFQVGKDLPFILGPIGTYRLNRAGNLLE